MALEQYVRASEELDLFLTIHGLKPASLIEVLATKEAKTYIEQYLSTHAPTWQWLEDYHPYSGGTAERNAATVSVYGVGKNRQALEALANAHNFRDHGFAFGYPEDAVEAYCNGARGAYLVELARARKAGVEIPSWVAYLTHVPAHLDIVGNRTSASSEQQARSYQALTRTLHPRLASRVEKELKDLLLPDEWHIGADGEYEYVDTSIAFKR